MNQSYKLVWNAIQQVWVVASELAKSHKKSKARLLCTTLCTSLIASTAWAAPAAHDLPQLANISSGAATVTNPVLGQLVINQTTDKLIANWNSFDVGQQARVDFIQPDSKSIALNRISSALPSQVFGQVNANGQLILVNPAGLVFGAQSQVNAASIVASTANISDGNFNSNNLLFNRTGSEAGIDNQGHLTATAGNVVLLANSIHNSGDIQSQQGNISLVNANQAKLDSNVVNVTQPSDIAGLIRNTGSLRATLIASFKGKIYLLGNRSRAASKVELGGTLDARSSLVRGRQIEINNNLTLKGNSLLDARNSISINATVDAVSNRRLLSLAHGTKAGEGVLLGSSGKINLSGLNMKYRENGQYYQIIKTLAELQAIDSGEIDNTDFSGLSGNYVLGADIDATATNSWNFGAGFSPLGGNGVAFTGIFNGLGHQISNLHIYRPDFDENSSQGGAVFPDPFGFSGYNIGLFGVTQNSTLKNIRLRNVNIVGYENVGGLVGQNTSSAGGQSVVENNQVSGSIRGAYTAEEVCVSYECESEGAPFDGYAFTGGQSVGGLIGLNQVSGHSLVQSNHSSVNVKGNFNIGGLAGNQVINSLASSTLQKNSSEGQISGNGAAAGLIGRDTSRQGGTSLIQLNHADTAITGSIYQLSNYAGGLIGYVDSAGGGLTTIRNNHASGNINGDSYLGGLVGMASSNAATIKIQHNYATGSVVGKSVIGGLVGANSVRNGTIIIRDTYASGQVRRTLSSSGLSGGLVGANSIFRDANLPASIRVSNSYWDADTTGQATAVGNSIGTRINLNPVSGAGGSFPNAFARASYANFDFEKIWFIADGSSRPMLRAFLNKADASGKVRIDNLYQLQGMQANLNADYVLSHDIDASATAASVAAGNNGKYADVWGGRGFAPVGSVMVAFQGSLDGKGHVVDQLTINRPDRNDVGLIGYAAKAWDFTSPDFVIANLNLHAVNMTGNNHVGGVVGQNATGLGNVHVSGTVAGNSHVGGLAGTNSDDATIFLSHADVAVNGLSNVGGLVGSNENGYDSYETLIERSYATGNVSGNDHVGGLVGRNYTSGGGVAITNSYATGQVTGDSAVGGLVGSNIALTLPDFDIFEYYGNASVSDSYSTGKVTGSTDTGGLVGLNQVDPGSHVSVSSSYWNADTAQINSSAAGVALNNTTIKQAGSFTGWDISNQLSDYSIWYIDEGVSAPQLRDLLVFSSPAE